jgi:tRNA threonylcarbamoyl adenosine modification protein YeaZ
MSQKEFILSIETAVQGGSISLLHGVKELDGWVGKREISKSEDILEEIKNTLKKNGLDKKMIKKIVVSRGPGSYTGVRIGMAVGFGLKKALNCELVGVSVLEGMLSADKRESIDSVEEVITAVPIGRNQICRQNFKSHSRKIIDNEAQPQLSTIENFLNSNSNSEFQFKKKIILHRKLYLEFQSVYKNRLAENNILVDAGENIAALIGMREAGEVGQSGILRPVYVREDVFFRSS